MNHINQNPTNNNTRISILDQTILLRIQINLRMCIVILHWHFTTSEFEFFTYLLVPAVIPGFLYSIHEGALSELKATNRLLMHEIQLLLSNIDVRGVSGIYIYIYELVKY